jgi:hypothetical protein
VWCVRVFGSTVSKTYELWARRGEPQHAVTCRGDGQFHKVASVFKKMQTPLVKKPPALAIQLKWMVLLGPETVKRDSRHDVIGAFVV